MLLSLLKKTLGPFGLIFVIVFAFILARRRWTFLDVVPNWVLILVVVAALVIWIVILLVRWIAEKRRAAAIEDGILDQARAGADQATPARRAEIQELNRNLAEAMALLKQGPQGKKALYTLPWYMIIGQPAAGKTTAIVNSNLNFPGMTTAKRMRGAGGTRSCDWWFSTDAILLDTAGRYADGADRSETEIEWFAFLDLLKSHRKKGPIDGLILAYSIEDIFQKDEAGVIDLARELRQRMDEILDRLGWTFPVYVLFTKCDLISGFTDYFYSLSPIERHQVWGAVYSPEPEGDQRAAERISHEFDLLLSSLRSTRPNRMSSVSRSEDWGRVFMFPEEFANLKDKIALLIETLFEANPYRKDIPIFRGTYFSSGKQLGKPFDLVSQKIQSMLGAQAEVDEVQEQEEKEDAYFVRDLFAKVLKTDRDLVRMTGEAARRRSRLALFVSAGFLALGVLACVWIGLSYGRLRARMNSIANVAEQIVNQDQFGTDAEELAKLEKLREKITGSWRSFPLVVTDDVHETARDVYLKAITERFLVGVENQIARELQNARGLNGAEVRRALRTELMLLRPGDRELIGWGAKELTEGLFAYGLEEVKDDRDARTHMRNLVEEFLRLNRPIQIENRDEELLRGANRLSETHTPREFYRGIIYEAGQSGENLNLETLIPDNTILRSRETVRAAFTGDGWERSVQPQIRDVEKTVDSDNQLIKLAGGIPTEQFPSKNELLELYRIDYPEEWVIFIESVKLGNYRNCKDLEDDLRKLRRVGTSPLFMLLQKAAEFSTLEYVVLGEAFSGTESIEKIQLALRPLSILVKKTDDQGAPLEEFAQELSEVYNQVDGCANEPNFNVDRGVSRRAKRWLDDYNEPFADKRMASALRTLMIRPVEIADDVLKQRLNSEAARRLNEGWTDAGEIYRDKLAGLYPFSSQSSDWAHLEDVTGFFGPSGSLAGFSEFLENTGDSVGPATKQALETAEMIREDLKMTTESFQAQFKLQAVEVRSTAGSSQGRNNLRKIDTVILTINGESLTYLLMKSEKNFDWNSDDKNVECSLVLESQKSHEKIASIESPDTIWGICHLFENARIEKQGVGHKVIWSFAQEGIEVEFLLTTREDVEPFFVKGSTFRNFSLPSGVRQ